MNREDVIRIALEVGFYDDEVNKCQLMLERFAYLIAEQEREACAKQLDALGCDHCATAIRARGQG
jgi:hypothetical protein